MYLQASCTELHHTEETLSGTMAVTMRGHSPPPQTLYPSLNSSITKSFARTFILCNPSTHTFTPTFTAPDPGTAGLELPIEGLHHPLPSFTQLHQPLLPTSTTHEGAGSGAAASPTTTPFRYIFTASHTPTFTHLHSPVPGGQEQLQQPISTYTRIHQKRS